MERDSGKWKVHLVKLCAYSFEVPAFPFYATSNVHVHVQGKYWFFFLQHDFYLKAVVIDCDFTYKAYDPFLKSNEML